MTKGEIKLFIAVYGIITIMFFILIYSMSADSKRNKQEMDAMNAKLDAIASQSDADMEALNKRLDEIEETQTQTKSDLEQFEEDVKSKFNNVFDRIHDSNEHITEVEQSKAIQRQQQSITYSPVECVASASYDIPTDGLTKGGGRYRADDGHEETWYNLNMSTCVDVARSRGIDGDYWVRDDGCKMLGDYVIVAASEDRYGEIVETSRGDGIVIDTGSFCQREGHENDVDVAVDW